MNSDQVDYQNQEDQPSQDTENSAMDAKFTNTNMAEKMDEDELSEIGNICQRGFELDLKSRADWESDCEEWIKLAKQVREEKSFPWPQASNVKYPLLSTAAMQFAARAYPSLVPAHGNVVNSTVVGKDPDGKKLEKARRVSTYMSYQLMDEMDGWEEGMDKLLMMLPIVGVVFKKTWYDKSKDAIRSEVILPKNLVVNYWAKNLKDAERVSEIIQMSPRVLKEKQNMGVYLDVELDEPTISMDLQAPIDTIQDETTPYHIIEQHTFYDFDDDGYAEPCIVTFERVSGKVLRISPRYHKDHITMKPNGKGIAMIEPIMMYTKYPFIPNPDGSFYDVGFGQVLGPINESINTGVNQLNDAASISNLQSGFIGKSLRVKMGDARFSPGEWRPVNSTGDDLKKQIVPLPTKDPSPTTLQLVELLITSGKELASVAEIFTGKMPGQNTPATTTMASIEQGMKVFTAIYKRIYRAMGEEFDKLFELNATYLDPQHYVQVLDEEVDPSDFDRSVCDIKPAADPSATSQAEKMMKAQALLELMQTGVLDPVQVVARNLEAQEQPNYQQLFTQQVQQTGQFQPPPDPKVMAIQAKMQADQAKVAIDGQATQQKMELESRDKQQQLMMKAQEHQMEMQFKQQEGIQNANLKHQEGQIKMAQAVQQAHTQAAQGQQQLRHSDAEHQQRMQQTKESTKLVSKSTPTKK
jgi:chaperonin GroES